MKAVPALLIAVLVIGILNLLQGFGVFGGKSAGESSHEYAVYTVEEVGLMIKFLIDEDFKKEGKTEYPAAILQNPRITLPRLMNHMSSEGWELVDIKSNGIHLFRRPIDSSFGDEGPPRLSVTPPEGDSGASATPDADADADAGDGAAAPAPATDAGASAPAPAPEN